MVPKYFEFRGKELNLNPNPDTRFISVLVRHICRLCVSWYPVYLMAEQIIDTDITVMAAAPAPGPGHRAAHWSCTPLNLARAQLPCTLAPPQRALGAGAWCRRQKFLTSTCTAALGPAAAAGHPNTSIFCCIVCGFMFWLLTNLNLFHLY